MQKRREGIYATHGKNNLMFTNARYKGKKALAFSKNGEMLSYILMDELHEQMDKTPYVEIADIREFKENIEA